MYLIQRGKNDQDINNIVEELETHLIEAEKNGIYTKSWIIIIIAITSSIAPISNRLIPPKYNNDPVFITITGIVIVLITITIFVFMYKSKNKYESK